MERTVLDQLRQAIRESGLSHHELSKRTGVAQPIISRFVSGERSLQGETFSVLCSFFRLELRPKKRAKKNP